METHLPDCPECGGDMMGFPHPVRKEALVWACRCCGATFVYDTEYNLLALLVSFATGEEDTQRESDNPHS